MPGVMGTQEVNVIVFIRFLMGVCEKHYLGSGNSECANT